MAKQIYRKRQRRKQYRSKNKRSEFFSYDHPWYENLDDTLLIWFLILFSAGLITILANTL